MCWQLTWKRFSCENEIQLLQRDVERFEMRLPRNAARIDARRYDAEMAELLLDARWVSDAAWHYPHPVLSQNS